MSKTKAAAPKTKRAARATRAKKTSAAKAVASKPKKASALDSAAKVLSESKEPMTCKEMIEAMAAKNYWKSAEGKTPANTLYSAILREVNTKGKDARFKKAERGKFTLA